MFCICLHNCHPWLIGFISAQLAFRQQSTDYNKTEFCHFVPQEMEFQSTRSKMLDMAAKWGQKAGHVDKNEVQETAGGDKAGMCEMQEEGVTNSFYIWWGVGCKHKPNDSSHRKKIRCCLHDGVRFAVTQNAGGHLLIWREQNQCRVKRRAEREREKKEREKVCT